MSFPSGTHKLGPGNSTLTVQTGRAGAASKAGHDLLLEVDVWEGTLTVGEGGGAEAVELTADSTSLRVREASGGMKGLDDDDRKNIQQTIDDEVLERKDISFSSTETSGDGGKSTVEGELEIGSASGPVSFELALGDDGRVEGSATLTQTNWKLKPYSALFGALKVADEVEVAVSGQVS